MLKTVWFTISLFLILFIFLNMPKELTGLSGFMDKSDIFNSPSEVQEILNKIIGVLSVFYLILAFYLN